MIFIYPLDNDLTNITDKLNKIEPMIDFTYELKTNYTLRFLNIFLMNNNNKLEFQVHHKSTNKNYDIHLYSHPNTKIKSEIVVSFYLRTLRICTPKYLNDEFDFIEKSFPQFQYLKSC